MHARQKLPPWNPKARDYATAIAQQNPWHVRMNVPDGLAPPRERHLARVLWRAMLADYPKRFHVVIGPRRVGKTTCLYQTIRHLLAAGVPRRKIWWLRLDHPLLMRLPLGGLLELVVSGSQASVEEPAYVFLDELVYAEQWDYWLKTLYDDNWPVRVAGTSSATGALRRKRAESGVGRWEEHYLPPLLFSEYVEFENRLGSVEPGAVLRETLERVVAQPGTWEGLAGLRRRFVLVGGFPELLMQAPPQVDEASEVLRAQQFLRSDAVERAIYKDIPQAFGVDNPLLLERLLYVLAGQVGGILSPTSLCRVLDGLSQPTFDRYVHYLESAHLIFTLPNYAGSEESRQRRGRKLYFVDSAVRNAALQRGLGPLEDTAELGLLYENLVASQLYALALRSGVRPYPWRHGGYEVDFVYDHPTEPVAFEVTVARRHKTGSLRKFIERFPRFRGRCYLVTTVPEPPLRLDPTEYNFVPLDALLLAAGIQAEHHLRQLLGGSVLETSTAPPDSQEDNM